MSARIGAEAVAAKGWPGAHKWLLLRRLSQISIFALFLAGPLAGYWIVKGNLAYSLTLDTLHLADPYVLLQSLLAGHKPERAALIGGLTVLAFYFLAGGRVYCSWVCPVNLVTDAAAWLREKLGIRGGASISRKTRYWMLVLTLALAAATGTLAWELVNPVSMLHRGIIFGIGAAWVMVLAVFLFDLFVSHRGWCGHLCPMGAFYSAVGYFSPLRVSAARRAQCNDCMDCFAVCPEPQVIRPALKGEQQGIGPVILPGACTNCGRCIDVCSKDVFSFAPRFAHRVPEKTRDIGTPGLSRSSHS
ncbi:MAG: quinol dehydrogenase ferredoxin subunit NapH [Betaproteobacteria bacterium]|nr:quinol dehydrogenase ferredoxin subunit NapH [Betaproteobacteria bacterium]